MKSTTFLFLLLTTLLYFGLISGWAKWRPISYIQLRRHFHSGHYLTLWGDREWWATSCRQMLSADSILAVLFSLCSLHGHKHRIQKYSMDSYVIQHLLSLFLTSDIAVLYQHRYHSLWIRGTFISQTLLPVQPVHQAGGKCVWSCHSVFWSGHYPAYKCGKTCCRILLRFGDGCKHTQVAKAADVIVMVAPTTLIAGIVMCAYVYMLRPLLFCLSAQLLKWAVWNTRIHLLTL